MIKWKLILSYSSKFGHELHYSGTYQGVPVQYAQLSNNKKAKSGATRIFVVTHENPKTRTEYKTERGLRNHIDSVKKVAKVKP